jgi:anti-sigma factor RsiW
VTTPCEAYSASIGELTDGTLPPSERARVEAHLDQCAACRGLLADLEAIRREARSLPRLEPPASLWTRVGDGLRAQGVTDADPRTAGGEAGGSDGKSGFRIGRIWLAAAAALVIVIVGAALAIRMMDRGPAPQTETAGGAGVSPASGGTGNSGAAGLVESVEADLRAAEEHYERAIAGLEKIASADERTLDPQVAATLKKNLEIIDGAIAESRAALRSEPQSAPARESLFEALRRKMSLLQDTIALMNEMRKGNQAGAAQILEGLQKS